MTWRVASSLNVLLHQLNVLAPNRSKLSDGSIGDAAHATRNSDHNPWYGPGIVTARDFTHDPAGGLDCNGLANALVTAWDLRIKYLIWNRRTWSKGRWSAYTGVNPHTKHLHLSVVASPLCDDTSPWNLGASAPPVSPPTIRKGRAMLIRGSAAKFHTQALASGGLKTNLDAATAGADPNLFPRLDVSDPVWDALEARTEALDAVLSEFAALKADVAVLKARPQVQVNTDVGQLAQELITRGYSGGATVAQIEQIIAGLVLVSRKEGNNP